MSAFYGVNTTKIAAVPMQRAEQGEFGGAIRVMYDQYELAATKAQNDTIDLGGLIPAGARILNVHVAFDSLDASGGTLDIGWKVSADGVEAVDADGFFSSLAVASAGAQDMMGDQPTVAGVFKKFSSAVQPYATVTHSGGLDATTGTLMLAIYYVVE